MSKVSIRRILVVTMTLAMIVPVMSMVSSSGDEGVGVREPRELREWTVMVYIGADNSFYETYDDIGDEVIVPFTLGQCERAFTEAEIDQDLKDVNLVVLVEDTSWIQFFDIYYDARWLLYNSGMGESGTRAGR